MHRILAGLETEYGLDVEGRGAEDQVDDAEALVRSYPGECLAVWDDRFESPRADLRGFTLDRLSVDPEDARFDAGRAREPIERARADRVLPNGARFYNDHGHPEYATPECLGDLELALHDRAGELAVLRAAQAFSNAVGRRARVYKNNTDFHGASYGAHESYLVPRPLGFERLFAALTPMLVARTVLCGAGKVGSEHGGACDFQMSQRADFLTEAASADTLFRRPVFNTRDEPHADPKRWIRVHVISGDANMTVRGTARKVGLAKLALGLAIDDAAPSWRLRDPAQAMRAVSRDVSGNGRIELEGGGSTTAGAVILSYIEAAERAWGSQGGECRAEWGALLADLSEGPVRFAAQVDWAAKGAMIGEFLDTEGVGWDDPRARAFDLEYHNIDPEEGLCRALEAMGRLPEPPSGKEVAERLERVCEPTRARARGAAVRNLGAAVQTMCWRSITFEQGSVDLDPAREVPREIEGAYDVESFMRMIRGER